MQNSQLRKPFLLPPHAAPSLPRVYKDIEPTPGCKAFFLSCFSMRRRENAIERSVTIHPVSLLPGKISQPESKSFLKMILSLEPAFTLALALLLSYVAALPKGAFGLCKSIFFHQFALGMKWNRGGEAGLSVSSVVFSAL